MGSVPLDVPPLTIQFALPFVGAVHTRMDPHDSNSRCNIARVEMLQVFMDTMKQQYDVVPTGVFNDGAMASVPPRVFSSLGSSRPRPCQTRNVIFIKYVLT